jgi:RIO-like serine/threonine protein kinase
MKITPGNASFEFNALKKLKRSGFVPQVYQKAVVRFANNRQKRSIMRNLFVNVENSNQATMYVMNKIDGIQLANYINQGGKWDETEKRRLRKIIHIMHSKGIIHGNFHSQNILVTLNPDGTIKKFFIIDFGQGMFKRRGVRTAKTLASIPVQRVTTFHRHTSPNASAQVSFHGSKYTSNNLQRIQANLGQLGPFRRLRF